MSQRQPFDAALLIAILMAFTHGVSAQSPAPDPGRLGPVDQQDLDLTRTLLPSGVDSHGWTRLSTAHRRAVVDLALSSEDVALRASAVRSLAWATDGGARQALQSIVDSMDAPRTPAAVRVAAVDALGFRAMQRDREAIDHVLAASEAPGLLSRAAGEGGEAALAQAWIRALARSGHRTVPSRIEAMAGEAPTEAAGRVQQEARDLYARVRELGPELAGLAALEGFGSRGAVRAHVLQVHRHGLPWAATRRLGLEALPALDEILFDPAQKSFWANAVGTIGLIAEPQGAPFLLSFLARAEGDLDPQHFRALCQVPTALGHLARNGSDLAWVTLSAMARGEYSLPSIRYGNTSDDTVRALFVDLSIVALGVAGTPDAKALLQHLESVNELPSLVDEFEFALDIHSRIRLRGAAAAFSR
jgi:hypothetical protein